MPDAAIGGLVMERVRVLKIFALRGSGTLQAFTEHQLGGIADSEAPGVSKIIIRTDPIGGHAVYSGETLLIDGLASIEAESFASFFRASARTENRKTGQIPSRGGRQRASRSGMAD